MSEHIEYYNGLKYTFHDDDTFNAFRNGEAYFDENQTLRRKDNGQICKSVKVEADDRFGCDGNNDDYSNDEEDTSSFQNYDTLPFSNNIFLKAIYYYCTNEEVHNTVNELVKYVAPKAKDFFCSKIMPSLKKGIGKIKDQAIKMFNEFMGKPNPKLKKQAQTNAKLISVKKPHNSKQSDKKVYMTEDEIAQERQKILFCLYTIYESSEKLKNAERLDEKTLLEELNNPEVVKQFKQYMQNPKALPLTSANKINLISLPERKEAIKVNSMEEKNG